MIPRERLCGRTEYTMRMPTDWARSDFYTAFLEGILRVLPDDTFLAGTDTNYLRANSPTNERTLQALARDGRQCLIVTTATRKRLERMGFLDVQEVVRPENDPMFRCQRGVLQEK